MREVTPSTPRALRGLVAAAALISSAPALALPWNIDMVDADTVKAYEKAMAPLPEGVVSQANLLTPISWRQNWAFTDRLQAEPMNPLNPDDEAVLQLGERMYGIYCAPCHGDGVTLGPVSAKGYPAVAVLAGDDGRLSTMGDAWVYLTIRNGSVSKLMPAYNYAMADDEMWAIVNWMRAEMPNAEAPMPVADTAADGETP